MFWFELMSDLVYMYAFGYSCSDDAGIDERFMGFPELYEFKFFY